MNEAATVGGSSGKVWVFGVRGDNAAGMHSGFVFICGGGNYVVMGEGRR